MNIDLQKTIALATTKAIEGKQETQQASGSMEATQKIGNPSHIDISALAPIVSRVRTDVTAIKTSSGPAWTSEPLTDARILSHLAGGVPRGCCPIKAGESVTRLALLDLDSHKGETPWAEMQQIAMVAMAAMETKGMHPVAFRSTGGNGIHIFLLWDDPQDAYSVRQFLIGLLSDLGYKNGTGGVAAKAIEVFPKQDSIAAGRFGNMFILPLSGKSEPLDWVLGLASAGKEWAAQMDWPVSPPVPVLDKPARQESATLCDVDANTAIRALRAIPNDIDSRADWFTILCSFKEATGEEGFMPALSWSALHASHDEGKFIKTWDSITVGRENGTPASYLFRVAQEHDFTEHIAAEFDAYEQTPEEVATKEKARQRAQAAIEKAKASTITFVDFTSLAHTPPPARQWIVNEWLPRGSVTTLFGRGGHGKSLVAQQLATAVANGMPWLGLDTTPGDVLGLFCEDEDDELQRRQYDLFTGAFLDPVEGSARLFLDARPGKPNTLVSFGPDRLAAPTLLMAELQARCLAIRPALIILDNISQMFAGQENARTEVTQFCNELTGIARQFNCAVLLLGHTAKAEGSEYSGSTAWDAAVRSRLFMERQDDGTTVLRKVKANYSALDEIRLAYCGGMFAVLPAGSQISPETMDAIKPILLAAIEKFTARQQSTSHRPTARNYLIKQMKTEQMLGGMSESVAHATMGKMIDAGELMPNSILPWKTSSRHPVQGLAVTK
jgi:hypothetical protein